MSLLSLLENSPKALKTHAVNAVQIDAQSLGVSRILFGLFYLWFSLNSYLWIGSVPDALFSPPIFSLGSLVSGFPSVNALVALRIVLLISIALTTVGLLTRWSTSVWLVTSIICQTFRFSFGKIDHDLMMGQVTLLIMIWLNWGNHLSIDQLLWSRKQSVDKKTSISLVPLSFLLAVGFLTAGIPKAIGWMDFDFRTGGFLSWLVNGYYNLGRQDLLANYMVRFRPAWIFEFADYSAVILEIGFLFAMFNGKLWRLWLLIVVFFHAMNALILNINFIAMAPIYLCFVDWRRCFPSTFAWLENHIGVTISAVGVLVALTTGFLLLTPEDNGALYNYLIEDRLSKLILSLFVWGFAMFVLGLDFFRYLRASDTVLVESPSPATNVAT